MAEICESHVHTEGLENCDVCLMSFVRSSGVVTIPNSHFGLVATVHYRICLRPLGFGLGKHLYSITLLPGEELEFEFYRSSKVSTELSQELSVEESYSQELSRTITDEWSDKVNSNFKIGGGVSASLDLGIFKVGGHVEPEYTKQEETFHKTFSQFTAKSQARIDRKFDIHMDTKTETTVGTRSVRKVKNNNMCQAVTYNYYQLMRKLRVELLITHLTFDLLPERQAHPIFNARIAGLLHTAHALPPRPDAILSALQAGQPGAIPAPAADAGLPISLPARATVAHAAIADDFNHPHRQLTLEQLADDPTLGEERDAVLGVAKSLVARFRPDVVSSQEFCVNTPGVTADAFTGRCLACDTHVGLLQQGQREQMRLDLIKAKLAAAIAPSAYGTVHSPEAAVRGAAVRLLKGTLIMGEAMTDADGFYVLSAKGLVAGTDMLTVQVVSLPAGLTQLSPASINFQAADGPVQGDFVARP